jgi:hypothetical protein
MPTPVSTPHKPSFELRRDARQWFYWYLEIDDAPIEVQINEVGPWLPTTVRADPNGVQGHALQIAGPLADLGDASVQLTKIAPCWIRARRVGTEIDVSRGRIDVV